MTHDDDDIPTIGAYMPPPPGGGGGDDGKSPWSTDRGGESTRRDDEGEADDDDAPTRAESADESASTEATAADDASDAQADSDAGSGAVETDLREAATPEPTGRTSLDPGPSAFAPTRGLTNAAPAGQPAAAQTPAEPGSTFVSTAGNPDAAPATYGEGDDEVPARIGGRFEVLQLLGKGGMGRVYRVKDKHISGRELALKVLHKRYSESPYFKELFFREIKTAQGFVSEHVNQVRDTGLTDDGQLFLTMDLVEGETLRALMRREHSLGVRHALEICRQVLLGLQSGHDQGFIHRDVKPENVMLAGKVAKTDENPFGVGARLLDFGLAGLAAELEEGGTHGTPMYMSPEQAKGERLDPRSDLFAVGTLLFELLVGSRPFHGKTVANVLTSVIETDAAPLIDQIEHVDKRVRKLLRKALAKKRDDRFQSAAEFIKAIEKAPAFQPATELPVWASAALVVLLATSAGSGFLWWQANEQAKAKDNENRTLQAQINAATNQTNTSQDQGISATQKLQEAQNKNDELRDTIEQLNAQLGETRLQLEAYERAGDVADVEDRTRITTLESEMRQLDSKVKDIQSERDTLKAQVAELELVQKAYNSQNDPSTRAAKGFDKLLTQIENGFLSRAHKTTAQLVDAEVFAETDGLPGKEFVEPLGAACQAIALFEQTQDPAGRSVYFDAARRAFHAVQNERAPFALAAEGWLGFRDSASDPDPQRLERLDAALAALDTRLGGMQVEAAAGTEDLWEAIENGPDDQDPTRAFQIAFQDGTVDDQLRALASRYASQVERAAARQGLDAGALLQADRLPVWAELLDDPSHAAAREWSASKDLILLAFAQEWVAGGSPRLPSDRDLNVSIRAPSQPAWDWRREVSLKARVVTSQSAWPLRPTKTAVYRRSSERSGTQWIVEKGRTSDGRPEDGTASWNVDRAFHRETAGEVESTPFRETPIDYTLHGGRTFAWLNESVDLNHETRVARFVAGSTPVPTSLGVSSSEVDRFADTLGDVDDACLVFVTADGKERWISPVLGLVREVSGEGEARQVTELVYTDVVR